MDSPLFYCERFSLFSPLFNRQQAVLQVLDAFYDSYDKSDPTAGLAARSLLGIYKEYIWQARWRRRFTGCTTPKDSLDALYNKTSHVYLNLKEFPQDGTRFAYTFAECICESALSEFPNSDKLLSESPTSNTSFLFVDEIGYLGIKDRFQSSDLRSPSSIEDSSKVYPMFFRILSELFLAAHVFCIITGRSNAISVQYTMEHSIYGIQNIQKILFSNSRQPLDELPAIIWEYTGSVPIYVSYVLSEWTKKCMSNAEMEPTVVVVFSTMLLASVLKIPLRTNETYFASNTFTLVYPKLVLKYLKTYYEEIPVFRFISHLFSMIIQSDSPVSRGWKFEILFSLVLYLKLCFCSKLGEMGIFQKTFVEDYSLVKVDGVQSRKPIPLFQYVAFFSSRVAREVSAVGLTNHPNAWNLFYKPFLSKEDAGQGVSLSLIKNETEKFLIPVAQQLDLEAKNIVVNQRIVSTKYSSKVIRQFTDHQNWLMNSRLYYEKDKGELDLRTLLPPIVLASSHEWLTLTSWLQGMLIDEPRQSWRVGLEMERERERYAGSISYAYAMQVEYAREAQSAGASSWMNTFLRERCCPS
eukprot:jgi/Galph1/2418/GphlegSOOS_G1103.1